MRAFRLPRTGALSPSCYRASVAIDLLASARDAPSGTRGAITARWLGTDRLRRSPRPPEATRRRACRGTDRRPAAPARAPAGPDPRPPRRPDAHPGDARGSSPRAGSRSIRVERGGEVTYHGPGQLVAYPIVALAQRGLLIRPLRPGARGGDGRDLRGPRRDGRPARRPSRLLVRCPTAPAPRKIGALGLRVERGVTYHGIALNVTVDLDRLRAHRPVRDARRRSPPRSPPSAVSRPRRPRPRRWSGRPRVFAPSLRASPRRRRSTGS